MGLSCISVNLKIEIKPFPSSFTLVKSATSKDFSRLFETDTRSLKVKTESALRTLDGNIETNLGGITTNLSDIQQTAIDYLGEESSIVSWLKTLNTTMADNSYSAYQAKQDAKAAQAKLKADSYLQNNTYGKKEGIRTHAFADGGIVTSPTVGLIGEAGYNEAIIPLKDSNDPLSQKAVVEELKSIKTELASIRKYNYNIEKNTKQSRYVA